jgi:hypothetical protein
VHAILKKLDLDYALNEKKPHAPSPIYDYYIERMKEYTPKLENRRNPIGLQKWL